MSARLKEVQKIEIYYDGHCGMCSSFIEWLVVQEHVCELVCCPYQDEGVERLFPAIKDLNPDKELVVRIAGGDVYRGAEAWVWCLWVSKKYRNIARLMNSDVMLPMVKKVCYLVSKNRLKMSHIFFGKKAAEVAEEVHKLELKQTGCDVCDAGLPKVKKVRKEF